MPIPLADQIVCVRRELALRRRVYPHWIETKKMTAAWATLQLEHMEAVLTTLEELAAQEAVLQPALFAEEASHATENES